MRSWPRRPTAEPAPDVLIVGGGVVGCSTAHYLTSAGARVLLLERDQIAAGASGVAAGMLAPQVEAAFDDPFFELTLLGRSEHPALAATLLDEVGMDVEFRTTGILRVARDEAERVELRRRQVWQAARGLSADWLEPTELGEREPLLRGAAGRLLAGGLWLPDDGQVRSPRLVQALAAASVRRGARVVEGVWATALTTSGGRVAAVESPVGRFSAESFVLAAGVWSRDLAMTAGLELPIRSVKGQIVVLRAIEELPHHVVWSGECYLVPKVDGQVILGATEEEGNYDRRPTLAGVGALAEAALEVLPAAGRLVVEGVWAGLRPAAPDRYPIVGRAPGLENLYLSTAHYRNGVLLGPLTGRLLTDLILTGELAPELGLCRPGRFAVESLDASTQPA